MTMLMVKAGACLRDATMKGGESVTLGLGGAVIERGGNRFQIYFN